MFSLRSVAIVATLMLGLTACTYTVPFTIKKSSPVFDVVGRGVSRGQRIVVLSPRSAQQVSGSLTAEAWNSRSTAGETAAGVKQTTDYSLAAVTAEKVLINHGLRVIDQGNLVAAMSDASLREAVMQARQSGGTSLLAEALLLGRAVKAEAALLIRVVKLSYSRYSVARVPNLSLASCDNNVDLYEPIAEVDMVGVNIADGEVLWSGSIQLRAADFLEADWTATHTYHACDQGEVRWNLPDGCNVCYRTVNGYSLPLSTTNDDAPPNTWMIERAVKQLVERFVAGAASAAIHGEGPARAVAFRAATPRPASSPSSTRP